MSTTCWAAWARVLAEATGGWYGRGDVKGLALDPSKHEAEESRSRAPASNCQRVCSVASSKLSILLFCSCNIGKFAQTSLLFFVCELSCFLASFIYSYSPCHLSFLLLATSLAYS